MLGRVDLPLSALASRRRLGDRIGDTGLRVLTAGAGLGAFVLVGLIVWKVVDGAWPSIHHFGIPFLWHQVWDPNRDVYGALNLIYGTAITSGVALLFAAPISVAIGLYLS